MFCFKIMPAVYVFLLFYTLKTTLADCYFESSIVWDEDWYQQKEITNFSSIICYNTSIEDYTYELFELDVTRQKSTNFLQLSITNSNFSYISYLINPVDIHKTGDPFYDFYGLALNFCGVKNIVGDAFKDFNSLTEIDLGFNDIEDINFVAYLPSSVNKLNLTNNKIKDVNFGLFTKSLDSLDLSFNRIIHLNIASSVPFWSFPVKRHIYLNDNNITKLELHPAIISDKLKVDLAHNNLQFFERKDVESILHLKMLNLSQSLSDLGLFNISKDFFSSTNLVLSNNKLLKLNKYYDFSRSQDLDFSNCSLNSFDSMSFQESVFGSLNFSHNNLKCLFNNSLFARSKIQTLDLSYNEIANTYLMFEHAHIENLNLSSNRISELNSQSFKNMEYIYRLDLSFNNIRLNEKSFVNCEDLVVLNLASSNISYVDKLSFYGLRNLKTLNLENNLINALHTSVFYPLEAIKEINLLNNKLTNIQTNLFTSSPLKSVILSGNNIETIQTKAFYNLTSLKHIRINKNNRHLVIKDYAFSQLPKVQEVEIKKSKLHEINLRIFSQVSTLKILDLKDNDITSIDFSNHTEFIDLKELHVTLKGDLRKKSFLRLVFLKQLTFWNSKIDNVEGRAFQGLFNLEVFELKNTKINHLSEGALGGLFTIKDLDAKNIFRDKHTLNSFMFRDLHSIENLNLSYIEFENIMPSAFDGLKSLTKLYLNHNKISSFSDSTFSGLKHLNLLDLSSNDLTVLRSNDFMGLTGLKILNLDDNSINDIELGALQNFRHLETLSMARNNLTEFKVGAFSNLCHLKDLDLQQNSISALLFESFLPLKSLVSLNLEFNNLKAIGHLPLVSNLKFLKRIGVAMNKWKCDYLGNMLVTFRNHSIDYSSDNLSYNYDNIEGIRCIDICKFLLCLKDSHGIN